MSQRVRSLGEFGLIKRISRHLVSDRSVIIGPGDDCAVLAFNKTHHQLFTCDTIIEGVEFRLTQDPSLIGRKALAVSLSDIAACAGSPRHAVVAMGMPPSMRVDFVDAVVKGMRGIARAFGVNIVGGDISRSRLLTITTSVIGVVEKKRLVLRKGARPDEMVFVTGPLGDSLKGHHLSFTPRVDEARYLAKRYRISAMIDISDGLVQDLHHILAAGSVGAVIYEELIPRRFPSTTLRQALYAGEDFELLFTLPRDDARRVMADKASGCILIGHTTGEARRVRLCDRRLRERLLVPKGFTHF